MTVLGVSPRGSTDTAMICSFGGLRSELGLSRVEVADHQRADVRTVVVDEGDQHRLASVLVEFTGWPSESRRASGGAGFDGRARTPANLRWWSLTAQTPAAPDRLHRSQPETTQQRIAATRMQRQRPELLPRASKTVGESWSIKAPTSIDCPTI